MTEKFDTPESMLAAVGAYANVLGQSLVNTAFHDWRPKLPAMEEEGDAENAAAVMMLECAAQVFRGILTGMTVDYPADARREMAEQTIDDLRKGVLAHMEAEDAGEARYIKPAAVA